MKPDLRVYVCGRVAVEADGRVLPDSLFPGRQGRLAFVYLAIERRRLVARDELAEVLWGDALPRSWDASLSALISKLRRLLGRAGLDPAKTLAGAFGCYQLLLPDGAFVDLEAAERSLEEAESHVRSGDLAAAYVPASVAYQITRRPLLPGEDGPWVQAQRARIRILLLRALEAVIAAQIGAGEAGLAVAHGEEAVDLDPFRESAWRLLMRAHAAAGNRAGALSAWERCRRTLAAELGTDPAPETERIYLELLRERTEVAPARVRGNLPAPVSSFVGREADLAAIADALDRTRLLTLTGVGGVGKTRLALEAAARSDDPGGAWIVELGGLRDPALVPQTIAAALGADAEGDPLASAAAALAGGPALVVLDNCEHLLTASARAADALLRARPGLRILCTSREPLNMPGEVVRPVAPLGTDGPGADAVRLFVERGTAASPDFRPTPDVVEPIVRRLDGIPLAIELAAPLVQVIDVSELPARLDERFELLTRGSPAAPPRQQTLRAAMDWSYDHLSEAEQRAFRRLGVFVGGFDVEAAVAVAGERSLLQSLGSRSLVIAEGGRMRLLETVREYAMACLSDCGELDETRDAHAAWFRSLVARAELDRGAQGEWLDRLDADVDNIRGALDHLVDGGADPQAGLRMAVDATKFWTTRGYRVEARLRVEAALASAPGADARLRGRALVALGILLRGQGEADAALAHQREAVDLFRSVGERGGEARALAGAADVALFRRDEPTARAGYEEALAIHRELSDDAGVARVTTALGVLAASVGNYVMACERFSEALEIQRRLGDDLGQAMSLSNLAAATGTQGDAAGARALVEQALAIRRRLGDKPGLALSLVNIGIMMKSAGEIEAARAPLEEALEIRRELGLRPAMVGVLIGLGDVERALGNDDAARARYLEAIDVAREVATGSRLALALLSLANLEIASGHLGTAQPLGAEALRCTLDLGDQRARAAALEAAAAYAFASGDRDSAAALLGAADGIRRAIGAPIARGDREDVDRVLDGLGGPDLADCGLDRAVQIAESVLGDADGRLTQTLSVPAGSRPPDGRS